LEVCAEGIKHAGNGDEGGGAFALNGTSDFSGVGGVFEDDGGAEQWWNEEGHELAEDMAQRNKRDEAKRMEPFFVLAIGIDAALERLEIGEEISVGEDDAARFGCGAGGEEDLRDVVAGDGLVSERFLRWIRRSHAQRSRIAHSGSLGVVDGGTGKSACAT